eukprot:m.150873 g.150873  ORF g.150873 m.150873 type:complete len:528 (-) comp15030_c0_seq17:134-1717(-)
MAMALLLRWYHCHHHKAEHMLSTNSFVMLPHLHLTLLTHILTVLLDKTTTHMSSHGNIRVSVEGVNPLVGVHLRLHHHQQSACLPTWKPTWNMSRSTLLYNCNASGMHDVREAVRYGVVVYDWSNAKHLWVNNHPMNDDDLLTKQAEMVLDVDRGIPGEQPRVWVYRNKAKGLNWYGSVREKLDDPQYAGWFVKFKNYTGRASNNSYHTPACDWFGTKENPPKCSGFYHDQKQSPTHEGAGPAYSRPSEANTCVEQCDCGPVNPCGEYTFDHRNASFSDWFVGEYMISNQTLLHDPMINLGWMDDGMSVNGMSEGDPPPDWIEDTGSTPEEVQDHQDSFRENVARLQEAVVAHGGFYYQMIQGTGPGVRSIPVREKANCHKPPPRNVTTTKCLQTLRTEWCTETPSAWSVAHLYLNYYEGKYDKLHNKAHLDYFKGMEDADTAEQSTAEFLLTRGDYAWTGYGWCGCESSSSPSARPRPQQWDTDYGGRALGPCKETGNNTGVFERKYPKATVQWDCNTGRGKINLS